jgi:2-amino-4-hydroxy-6-hydroxymethyldihydropteridine diphosphokinase
VTAGPDRRGGLGGLGEPLVIGLGGNVGGEEAIIARFRRAREALAMLGELRSAPLYRTEPITWPPGAGSPAAAGPAQPAYLNTAVRLRVADLSSDELLATVRELEHLLGRDRRTEARWGPRPIDLDVLVWGGRVLRTPDLEVPHPRLAERRFALAPLVALLGEDFEIPGAGAAGALLGRVRDQGVLELAASW